MANTNWLLDLKINIEGYSKGLQKAMQEAIDFKKKFDSLVAGSPSTAGVSSNEQVINDNIQARDKEKRDVEKYYKTVKNLDNDYYDYSKKKIDEQVSQMAISNEQKILLQNKLVAELNEKMGIKTPEQTSDAERAKQLRDTDTYYRNVREKDNSYYDYKLQKIKSEVAAMAISDEQKILLEKKLTEALNQEAGKRNWLKMDVRGFNFKEIAIGIFAIYESVVFAANAIKGLISEANKATTAVLGLSSAAVSVGSTPIKALAVAKELTADNVLKLSTVATSLKYLTQTGFKVNEAKQIVEAFKQIGAFGRVVEDFDQAVIDAARGVKTSSVELIENIGLAEKFAAIMKRANIDISAGIDLQNNKMQRQALLMAIKETAILRSGDLEEYLKQFEGMTKTFAKSWTDMKVAMGYQLQGTILALMGIFKGLITFLNDNASYVIGVVMVGAITALVAAISKLYITIEAITKRNPLLIVGTLLLSIASAFMAQSQANKFVDELNKKMEASKISLEEEAKAVKKTKEEYKKYDDAKLAAMRTEILKKGGLGAGLDSEEEQKKLDTYRARLKSISEELKKPQMMLKLTPSSDQDYLKFLGQVNKLKNEERFIQGEIFQLTGGLTEEEKKRQKIELIAIKELQDERNKLTDEEKKKREDNIKAYYDAVRFNDEQYYNWKIQQINKEANQLNLTADQRKVFIRLNTSNLDKERAEWNNRFEKIMDEIRNKELNEFEKRRQALEEKRLQLQKEGGLTKEYKQEIINIGLSIDEEQKAAITAKILELKQKIEKQTEITPTEEKEYITSIDNLVKLTSGLAKREVEDATKQIEELNSIIEQRKADIIAEERKKVLKESEKYEDKSDLQAKLNDIDREIAAYRVLQQTKADLALQYNEVILAAELKREKLIAEERYKQFGSIEAGYRTLVESMASGDESIKSSFIKVLDAMRSSFFKYIMDIYMEKLKKAILMDMIDESSKNKKLSNDAVEVVSTEWKSAQEIASSASTTAVVTANNEAKKASNLNVMVSGVAAGESTKGLFALITIPIAIAGIMALLGKFMKFGSGGTIGGKLHSDGGTIIEAEQGEEIIRRSKAYPFRSMLKFINNAPNSEVGKLFSYFKGMGAGDYGDTIPKFAFATGGTVSGNGDLVNELRMLTRQTMVSNNNVIDAIKKNRVAIYNDTFSETNARKAYKLSSLGQKYKVM